ncbi:MAG: hypothetical protein J5663_01255 [Bacteroidaceae bacterium]|nr:hypothetical protein [Bacteroidaceae bacterium]
MTAVQLNAEVLRAINDISDDETLMNKVLKYIKKLTAKKADPTLMTKEEFFANIEEAEQQYARGEYTEVLPNEDLATHLKRLGYEI